MKPIGENSNYNDDIEKLYIAAKDKVNIFFINITPYLRMVMRFLEW